MRWSQQLLRSVARVRYLLSGLGLGVLGVASCVSLSSPRSGTANLPVATGSYKNGRNQVVRIALATGGENRIGGTGDWALYQEGGDTPIARHARADSVTTTPSIFPSGAAGLVVRPLDDGSFITWNGKPYRGELLISITDSGALVVNRLPMDSYLRGVVPLEIGNRTAAEIAAVQAQAVAARTYAYKHLNNARAFDMYATVQDQVYGGVNAEKPLSDSAINSTADAVVLYAGKPITTPYHSTCGGTTAAVSEVWYDQPDEPYLRPVSDRIPGTTGYYCDPSPRFSWTQSYDAAGLQTVMEKYLASYTNAPKTDLGRITDVTEQGRTESGRVAALAVRTQRGNYVLKGNDIRFVLRDPKGAILNSTLFTLSTQTSDGHVTSLTINGRGYGHGIGMCQWGAIGRARAGQNYRTILETYYPGTTIGRIAG
jgi:stage II sporulation protein D